MSKFLNNVKKDNDFLYMAKNKYYVDKTKMISIFNNIMDEYEHRYVCVTRPRRFGKSLNALMLASYYAKNLDMHETFETLNIHDCDSYEKHLNKHNVIYISFNTKNVQFKTYEEYRDYFIEGLIEDMQGLCPEINPKDPLGTIFDEVYTKLDTKFIFIIDEWDYIFNNDMYTKSDRKNFLEFLEGLLKDKAYVQLTYMTGILPIAKYSSGSSLNMFYEYDAISDTIYGDYFGFLEEEVQQLCERQKEIKKLSDEQKESLAKELQDWYNGYKTCEGKDVYNSRSVVRALRDGVCQSYWTNTGKKKEVAAYINLDVDGLTQNIIEMIAGNSIEIKLDGYDAESKTEIDSRNLALSAMTILGFLSYHNYKLQIPNRELMMEFREMVAISEKTAFKEIIKNSDNVLQATLDKDEEKLAELIEETHNLYNSYFEYNTENSLSCVIAVAYLSARNKYVIKREDVGALGRADFSFYPLIANNTAFIIELKKDKTPEYAINQIKEKKYFSHFKNFKGEKLLIGIAYDTDTKKHSVKIEALK